MRLRAARSVAVLALALATLACDQPVPPPVIERQHQLDADDLAVMRGVLDYVSTRPDASEFLVVETTAAICQRPSQAFGSPPGGCLGPTLIDAVTKVLPVATRRTAALDFEARNATRLPIVGALGADVSYISSTVVDFMPQADLLRQHRGVGAIVTFSAPSYPEPRVAVIAYSSLGGGAGAARLMRQGSQWSVDVATMRALGPWVD